MSHVPSHHSGAIDAHDTFLAVFKVHGDAIHLWPKDKAPSSDKPHTFRISCHNVETHSDHPGSDIQVFMLTEPAPLIDECTFRNQEPQGEVINYNDIATFLTGPVPSTRKASYAIDLALVEGLDKIEEKLGTAYLYLDPNFSSQGIQKTPIIAAHNHAPIGQIKVEYLVVTNPLGYGQPAPKPDWLFKCANLDAGHRGAGSGRRTDLPDRLLENTVASFNYAHQNGADMCELDVIISADGIPIVYHDFDVNAVAGKKCNNLGKFKVQVNDFTVEQLRDFQFLALHDAEGCSYTLNVPNQAESNRPFPTLAEVLEQVEQTCGLNVEIKWPQQLESGQMEARRYREINDFVDRIINVVDKHAGTRRIILESFDADIVIMLRLKQNRFPVIFLSQGMTDRYERYVDVRARSVRNGIYFAQAFDLAGIDLILDYYVLYGKKLVDFIKNHGLIARAWGDLGDGLETLAYLKDLGLQCITYDKIDLVKEQENQFVGEKKQQLIEKFHASEIPVKFRTSLSF